MTAHCFFCHGCISTEVLPNLSRLNGNHTNSQPGCCTGDVPVLVAMLTQYSEAGVEAFNILYEVTYRDNLPADHTEAVEGLLVRLRAHHRMCHVLAACLPPVQGGSMFIPGTDDEPVLHSSTHNPSICPSILLSVHPFVRQSICPFIHLPIQSLSCSP